MLPGQKREELSIQTPLISLGQWWEQMNGTIFVWHKLPQSRKSLKLEPQKEMFPFRKPQQEENNLYDLLFHLLNVNWYLTSSHFVIFFFWVLILHSWLIESSLDTSFVLPSFPSPVLYPSFFSHFIFFSSPTFSFFLLFIPSFSSV